MNQPYKFFVVSQTHWDREWYLPFQLFRLRLVDLMDHLLDILDKDPDYKYYVLDGQTVVLDDYFEIKPQNRERVKKYIQEGRILVGPWYILPDEFLVSGEATIRNLMLGHKKAMDMGAVMKAGYVPDPFGHLSQLPQILQGFGIDNFIFMRGFDQFKKMEFMWESPDGTKVLAVRQKDGYGNAAAIPTQKDETIKCFERLLTNVAPFHATENVLINNGVDHLEPQPELGGMIKMLHAEWKKAEVIHSTFPEFIAAVKKANPVLETYKGELRQNEENFLLFGVLSARMYLKQTNERCQTALEKFTEPLNAMAWMQGGVYPTEAIWHAWTWLIKNHPHDSICGCSVDEVHAQMMTRFAWSKEIADDLSKRALFSLAPKIDTRSLGDREIGLIALNTLNWDRNDVCTADVFAPINSRAKGVRVWDAFGKEIPAQVLDVTSDVRWILDPQRTPYSERGLKVKFAFKPEGIPASGYQLFKVKYYEIAKPASGELIANGNVLENELIHLEMNANGTFDLTDKSTGKNYFHCHTYEDGGDMGDEYNYSPPVQDQVYTSHEFLPLMEIITNTPLLATVKVSFNLSIPESLTSDRKHRSEKRIDCPVVSYITVKQGSSRVDIVTEIDNKAKDHRFRVLFPTDLETGHSFADGQFDVIQRDILPTEDKDYTLEVAPTLHPQQGFVDLTDGDVGLGVINQGLPEYEIINVQGKTIALTLLRSCAWLGCGDLLTRCAAAGPEIPTPGAQCLGKHTFKYAVIPHVGNWEQGKLYQSAMLHNADLYYWQETAHPGELPVCYGYMKSEPECLILTAMKKADAGDALVLRYLNISDSPVKGTIKFAKDIKRIQLANLNEEPIKELTLKESSVEIAFRQKQLQTLLVEFK